MASTKSCRVFVNDLKKLEQGIEFHFSDKVKEIHGGLVLFLGDNLAANSLLGFQESFSAQKYCRFISMSSDCERLATRQDGKLLHSSESVNADLKMKNPKSTGVKFDSLLNGLSEFNATESFSPDIMHNILESACRFDLIIIIKYGISSKLFTLAYLNDTMNSFQYG